MTSASLTDVTGAAGTSGSTAATPARTENWTPAVIAAIESIISERARCEMRVVDSEDIVRPIKTRHQRRYGKHILRSRDEKKEQVIFTKIGPAFTDARLEFFISNLDAAEFTAPRFFGEAQSPDGLVRVWEYVIAQPLVFKRLSREQLAEIVRAVAAMNAITSELLQEVGKIPVAPSGFQPVAERLDSLLQQVPIASSVDAGMRRSAELFAHLEDSAITRAQGINERFFSHQDIKTNVLRGGPQGALIIFDWESAAISIPGSGLRILATLGPTVVDAMAEEYVSHLKSKGISLRSEDVRFIIGAAQVFSAFRAAINRMARAPERAMQHLHWGLNHVATYLDV